MAILLCTFLNGFFLLPKMEDFHGETKRVSATPSFFATIAKKKGSRKRNWLIYHLYPFGHTFFFIFTVNSWQFIKHQRVKNTRYILFFNAGVFIIFFFTYSPSYFFPDNHRRLIFFLVFNP